MKKWVLRGLGLAAVVAAVVATYQWWPPLLAFMEDHPTVFRELEALAKTIALFGGAVGAFFGIKHLTKRWREPAETRGAVISIDGPVDRSSVTAIGGDVEPGGDANIGTTIIGDYVKEKIVQAAPVGPATVPHQLPAPPADFTGREEELAKLIAAVAEGGATISGLRGMGGVGKTALALELGERLTPQYDDAQFYLDLKGTDPQPLSTPDAMRHVIRAYHPTDPLPENEAQLAALYRSLLHGKRALLLMDNAASAEQVRPLIPPEGCLLLVTSRQRFTLPGLHSLDLDILPPEDARDLLLSIAPRIGELVGELAELCGHLPLALRVAASALAPQTGLSPAYYMGRLGDARRRLELVDASLSMSYELLSGELKERWSALAVFPDTFDRLAAAAVWGIESDDAQDPLSGLVARSLVEWNQETGRYRLHDLARDCAEARLGEGERAVAGARHAAHYLVVAALAGDFYLKGGEDVIRGLALFDLEWPNLRAGQAWAQEHVEEDDAVAAMCCYYPDASVHYLDLRQHPRQRIAWLAAALAAARRLGDRRAEGANLGNLGLAYADLGETRQAIEFHEGALAISREIGDRRAEGQDLSNLASAYLRLGYIRPGIEYYEQALAISREIGDRRGEGQDLGNLGIAHKDLGEPRRAIEFHQQALGISREIGDRRGEGQDLGNLGNAYADLGDTRRAIAYYEQALVISREMGDPRGEGQDLGNLGSAYLRLGEIRRAIEYYERGLAIDREIGDRRGEGQDLGNLGSAYLRLSETRRAIELYHQRLSIAREIGDRRGEGHGLWNLSLALNKLGQQAQAIARAQEALAVYEEIEDPFADTVRKALREWRGQAGK